MIFLYIILGIFAAEVIIPIVYVWLLAFRERGEKNDKRTGID
jgi:hypothetical protein